MLSWIALTTPHGNPVLSAFRAHPRVMASPRHFDCIVIGSGQAGTPLAAALAKGGRKTALIERIHIGGCCVNEGCTPTKTMVASGRAAYLTRRGADYGIHTPGGEDGKISIDMLRVRQRKRDIVNSFRSGNESRIQSAGVEILMGEASFGDSKSLHVKLSDESVTNVTADEIFINTGERPARPELPGTQHLDPARVLDSTSIQELGEVPGHLIVLGGGYVGLEFAQLFRRLGSAVTVIQRNSQLLPREDQEIAKSVLDILREDGLTVHLEANATSVSSSGEAISLTCQLKNGKEEIVNGTHLLFAAGRVPNTEMLNLNSAGIKTNSKGYIVANDKLETTAPGVYVLGDAKGPPAFTHISYDDFRIIQANLITKSTPQATTRNRLVPYVVYTDPQLGHVGLHEHEARSQFPGRNIKTARMPMEYVARALETDEARGMMKAVIDGDTGEILGFTCLGVEGGEIMSIVEMAIIGKVGYEKLRDAVWAHPALAESLNNIWGYLK